MRTEILLSAASLALLFLGACSNGPREAALAMTGGAPERGAAAISRYGCGSCHVIAGISAAHGLVGPPLSGVGQRTYVAGSLQNRPDNLEHWIRDPQSVNQHTAMPNLGVTERDAVDIAAYLYSLK